MSDTAQSATTEEFEDPWFDDENSYETVYEVEEYPLPAEGPQMAEIIDTETIDSPFEEAKSGDKVLNICFRLDETYESKEGDKKHHTIKKVVNYRYGKTSKLREIFVKLTGNEPIVTRRLFEKDGKKYKAITFQREILHGMKCKLNISHDEKESGTFPKILDYKTTAEQRSYNNDLIKHFLEKNKKDRLESDPLKDDE